MLTRLGFDDAARAAALVVTGEGRLDEQTFNGKVVGQVARRAATLGIRCHAVVGRSALPAEGARRLGLTGVTEAGTPETLQAAGRRFAAIPAARV